MINIEEELNRYEYQILTKTWDGTYGAAYNACAEICIENGWMDHFGFVSPKGYRAIEAFEKKADTASAPEPVIEDFDTGERVDVV